MYHSRAIKFDECVICRQCRCGVSRFDAAMSRTICLEVEEDFRDGWLESETTTTKERTRVLRFACSLPRTISTFDTTDFEALIRSSVEGGVHSASTAREETSVQLTALAGQVEMLTRELATQKETRDNEVEIARLKATEATRREMDCTLERVRDDLERTERELSAQLRAQMNENDAHNEERTKLKEALEQATTPAGKGRSAEMQLLDAFLECGFEVTDTTAGAYKDSGYLDLLLTSEHMRIAVEIKNRAKINPYPDISNFEQKTKLGIQEGRFDGAIFVSIRAHTKKGAIHKIELMDGDGERDIPVSYVGPSLGAAPLTADAIQAHVCAYAALLSRFTSQALAPRDPSEVSLFLNAIVEDVEQLLLDLNQQTKQLDSVVSSIKEIRIRTIRRMLHMGRLNTACALPAWVQPVSELQSRINETTPEMAAWKCLAEGDKKKITTTIGKDVSFQVCTASKRKRN